jgi:hypothetical protein
VSWHVLSCICLVCIMLSQGLTVHFPCGVKRHTLLGVAVAVDPVTTCRDLERPAMQSAALDAIRDIAHLRAAALNMAERSVISSIIAILATTTGPSAAEGTPPPPSKQRAARQSWPDRPIPWPHIQHTHLC